MRDVAGNMALPAGNPIPYGTRPASSALQNSTLADIANELTDSLSRSGKGAMLAALNMGGFDITNVGQITGNLTFPGTVTFSLGPVFSALTASRVLALDASKNLISTGATTTELGFLTGVTSNIQTQLNAKQATITGAVTSVISSDLTASRAVVSDGSGKVGVSSVTSTELGYLSGATSSVQTQINSKLNATNPSATGTITASGLIFGNGGGLGLGRITTGTAAPSGGTDGDIYFRY